MSHSKTMQVSLWELFLCFWRVLDYVQLESYDEYCWILRRLTVSIDGFVFYGGVSSMKFVCVSK